MVTHTKDGGMWPPASRWIKSKSFKTQPLWLSRRTLTQIMKEQHSQTSAQEWPRPHSSETQILYVSKPCFLEEQKWACMLIGRVEAGVKATCEAIGGEGEIERGRGWEWLISHSPFLSGEGASGALCQHMPYKVTGRMTILKTNEWCNALGTKGNEIRFLPGRRTGLSFWSPNFFPCALSKCLASASRMSHVCALASANLPPTRPHPHSSVAAV